MTRRVLNSKIEETLSVALVEARRLFDWPREAHEARRHLICEPVGQLTPDEVSANGELRRSKPADIAAECLEKIRGCIRDLQAAHLI